MRESVSAAALPLRPLPNTIALPVFPGTITIFSDRKFPL
jgi:hypothetical protein